MQGRVDGLYIVLISLHGLVRGQHMELGRDADTGGQARADTLSPNSAAKGLTHAFCRDWQPR